jgi:hypothetical protein
MIDDFQWAAVYSHDLMWGQHSPPKRIREAGKRLFEAPISPSGLAFLNHFFHGDFLRLWQLALNCAVVIQAEVLTLSASHEIEIDQEGFPSLPLIACVIVPCHLKTIAHIDPRAMKSLGYKRCSRFMHPENDVDHDKPGNPSMDWTVMDFSYPKSSHVPWTQVSILNA